MKKPLGRSEVSLCGQRKRPPTNFLVEWLLPFASGEWHLQRKCWIPPEEVPLLQCRAQTKKSAIMEETDQELRFCHDSTFMHVIMFIIVIGLNIPLIRVFITRGNNILPINFCIAQYIDFTTSPE